MQKQNICLRTICQEDEQNLLDILTNNIVKQTYMLPDFDHREDALPLFRKLFTLSNDKTRYVRGIYRDGVLIGFINDVENEAGVIELGYVIHPDYHGQGYMTQALILAIGELFAAGYHEVITGAFEHNAASIRVMEKAGMVRIEKIDMIDYRGKTHRCVYYHTVKS